MANIRIWTEETFRKRGYIDETPRHWITADELYDILNSAVDDGTTKEYILLKPEPPPEPVPDNGRRLKGFVPKP